MAALRLLSLSRASCCHSVRGFPGRTDVLPKGLFSVSSAKTYYTATKTSTEVGVEGELLHAGQSLVEEGMQTFAQCPQAYTNFDPQDISFQLSFHENRHIQILHKGQRMGNHLTPWASASFALMGPRGNSASTARALLYPTPPLQNAQQRIGICTLPRHGWEDRNEDMVGYVQWLNRVALKYRAFLETNYQDISILQKKYRGRNPNLVKTMLAGDLVDPVKSKYDESTDGNYQMVSASRNIYISALKTPDLTLDCDIEIYSKYGLVPARAPIYDSRSTPIPLTEERPVQRGDVVSLLMNLYPYVAAYNDRKVLVGFKMTPVSTTILMAKRFSGVRKTFPFEGMGDVGGWIYEQN